MYQTLRGFGQFPANLKWFATSENQFVILLPKRTGWSQSPRISISFFTSSICFLLAFFLSINFAAYFSPVRLDDASFTTAKAPLNLGKLQHQQPKWKSVLAKFSFEGIVMLYWIFVKQLGFKLDLGLLGRRTTLSHHADHVHVYYASCKHSQSFCIKCRTQSCWYAQKTRSRWM